MTYRPDTDYPDFEEPLDEAQFELEREQATEDAEADRFEYDLRFNSAEFDPPTPLVLVERPDGVFAFEPDPARQNSLLFPQEGR